MNNQKIILVSVAFIFLTSGFICGMSYQKTKKVSFSADRQFARPSGAQVRRMGGGRVIGQIISVDAKTISVKMPDNSSKIILLSDKTIINKAATGTIADLTAGAEVAIFGSDNADGSVTAQSIQLNPTLTK